MISSQSTPRNGKILRLNKYSLCTYCCVYKRKVSPRLLRIDYITKPTESSIPFHGIGKEDLIIGCTCLRCNHSITYFFTERVYNAYSHLFNERVLFTI